MSIQLYAKKFPILARLASPRGQVELLETVGKGNYGYVYKGKLLATQQMAAVKVVFLKEDEIRETLLEMEILQQCTHPHITKYLGTFLKGLDLWICMEYCGGGSLDSIYRGLKKPLSEDIIASILYESVLALDYLHTKVGLIHRDIKAGNLLLTDDGFVKLADFGVSAMLKMGPGGRANTFIGTPYWMAPEVILTDPDSATSATATYDAKADIWSIGITAIEIAEKNPPLADIHPMRALHLIPKSDLGLAKPKNFSKVFVDFVSVCLTKNPTKRPSAEELLRHPFLAKAGSLPRQKLLSELVAKAKFIRERRKQGHDVDADEDEEETSQTVAPKVVTETMHQAKQSQMQRQQQEEQQRKTNQEAAVPSQQAGSSAQPNTSQSPLLSQSASQQPQQPARASLTNVAEAFLPSNLTASFTKAASIASGLQSIPNSLVVDAGLLSEFPSLQSQSQDESVTLFTPQVIAGLKVEVYTADVLDEQYLILGTDKGMYFLDLVDPSSTPEPVLLHRNTRFRQIFILESHGVLIALSGKRDQIRQYRLPSIRRLIRYLKGDNAAELAMTNMNVPLSQIVLGGEAGAQAADDEEYERVRPTQDDEATLVTRWASDFIKIPGTREAKTFSVQKTETTVYLSVLFRQDMILFEWAKEPYLKFMKLKEFWLPETPRFFQVFQNGLIAKDICLGYTSELNRVHVEDSQVKEIPVHRDFSSSAPSRSRWQSFVQIPFSDSALQDLVKANSKLGQTVNRKLAAVTGPTLGRLGSTQEIERYFLATYHRLTKVVDQNGTPMQGPGVGGWTNGVMWTEPPEEMILRPLTHVVSVGKNMIEIVDWKSAQLRQRISLDSSANFRFMSTRAGFSILAVEKKRRGVVLYWMKEKPAPAASTSVAQDAAPPDATTTPTAGTTNVTASTSNSIQSEQSVSQGPKPQAQNSVHDSQSSRPLPQTPKSLPPQQSQQYQQQRQQMYIQSQMNGAVPVKSVDPSSALIGDLENMTLERKSEVAADQSRPYISTQIPQQQSANNVLQRKDSHNPPRTASSPHDMTRQQSFPSHQQHQEYYQQSHPSPQIMPQARQQSHPQHQRTMSDDRRSFVTDDDGYQSQNRVASRSASMSSRVSQVGAGTATGYVQSSPVASPGHYGSGGGMNQPRPGLLYRPGPPPPTPGGPMYMIQVTGQPRPPVSAGTPVLSPAVALPHPRPPVHGNASVSGQRPSAPPNIAYARQYSHPIPAGYRPQQTQQQPQQLQQGAASQQGYIDPALQQYWTEQYYYQQYQQQYQQYYAQQGQPQQSQPGQYQQDQQRQRPTQQQYQNHQPQPRPPYRPPSQS